MQLALPSFSCDHPHDRCRALPSGPTKHTHTTTNMSSEDLAKDSDVGAKERVAPQSLEAPTGRFARFWGKSMTQVALIGMCCFLW